jgi:Cu+-exporting ATPase
MVEGRRVVLGNGNFLAELGIASAPLDDEAERLRQDGATVIFLAIDGKLAGLIAIADPVKPTTPAALDALRREGLRIVMLTGDNRTTAQAVAKRLGITEVEAEVLPEHKAETIVRLRQAGRVVAMAGDGVNDAPALAAADVGIAMGTGTDVAIESAGITLLKGDLTGIVRARKLSAAVMRNIRQNLFFAFIYNAAGVPIAAGVLYPVSGIPGSRHCCAKSRWSSNPSRAPWRRSHAPFEAAVHNRTGIRPRRRKRRRCRARLARSILSVHPAS